MKLTKSITYTTLGFLTLGAATQLAAEESYGVSFSGTLALPENQPMPYAKPDAPKGGRIVYAEYGSYDNFSPYIVEGKAPWGMRANVYESFFIRSVDESFSLYCLLCEKIDIDEERTYIEFWLRPEAKFSDGSPVTIDDVIWSYNTLAEKGVSRYGRYMSKVTSMEQTSDTSVRFNLDGTDREVPLLLGMMPILKSADWEGKDFAQPTDAPTTGSSPYMVDDYKMGEYITLKRNDDYWGKDLPITQGLWNFDEIKYIYFADPDAMFEAVKSGDVNIFAEADPKRWESYDFPLFNDGEIVKETVEHSRPAGADGFFINTRRPPFDDPRVREAVIAGFNFPFINQTINDGAYPRIDSYYTNSYLAGGHDAADGKVKELLEQYSDLPEGALEGYNLPAGNESGRDRDGVAHAMSLLEEAGFTVQDGVMKDADGKPFEFSVTVKTPEEEKLANLWGDGLKPLGIKLNIENVDGTVWQEKLDTYDFDVIRSIIALSLSPGNEQYLYWGSESADQNESRNYAGLKSEAVDGLINEIVSARNTDDYVAAVQALDRVLLASRITVPFWFNNGANTLHPKQMVFPTPVPKFGYWPGYSPDAFYWDENM